MTGHDEKGGWTEEAVEGVKTASSSKNHGLTSVQWGYHT